MYPFPKAIGCVEPCYRMAERCLAVDHTKLPHETTTKMPLDENRTQQSECDPLIGDLEERCGKEVVFMHQARDALNFAIGNLFLSQERTLF